MKRALVCVLFIVGCTRAPTVSEVDATGARMREVIATHRPAVVTLKMVLKENMSFGGFGNNQSESVTETTATVISPDGLIVTSLSATKPGGMFREMFDMLGSDTLGIDMNFDTQIKEVTIIFESGDEAPGRFVLRDRDLDLAFLRPQEAPAEPLAHVSLADRVSLQQFDRVMLVKRMGKVVDRGVSGNTMRIASLLETPRLYYVLADVAVDLPNTGIGLPAFDLDGSFVGMTIFRRLKLGTTPSLSLFGNTQSNTAMVIVPAADIQESADQAPGYSQKPEADAATDASPGSDVENSDETVDE